MTPFATRRTLAILTGLWLCVAGGEALALEKYGRPLPEMEKTNDGKGGASGEPQADESLIGGYLLTGAFTLALGLIMIAAHQRWDSGAGIVISVLGWITAIRGAVLLLAADFVGTIAPYVIQFPPALMVGATVLAALGLWLSFVGFAAKPV